MPGHFHISDEFWKMALPLLPKKSRDLKKQYKRKKGAGKKPLDFRLVLEGIIYVLKTGCKWKSLPKEYNSSSSIHFYFRYWESRGVFNKMWQDGLAMHDDMEGISWKWKKIPNANCDKNIKEEINKIEKLNNKRPYIRRIWYPIVAKDNRRK